MRTMEEDFGWAGRGGGGEGEVRAYILIFSKETSFTLEYENGSIGGSESKQHCL